MPVENFLVAAPAGLRPEALAGVLDHSGHNLPLLALFGPWVAIFIPLIGAPLFFAGLMIWFVPGLLFGWTGLFEFHEFGAAPAGWAAHR